MASRFMLKEMFSAARVGLRRIPERWRRMGLAVGGLALLELGARIVAPGLNGQILSEYFRLTRRGGLLGLYDWLVGGALSRGAVLALGIMPYVSARIMLRLAREAFPAVGKLWLDGSGNGRRTRTRWTRILTTGVALVQSYGYARFVQSIPGAVAQPGAAFVAETMLVLTGGAIFVMLLSERFTAPNDAESDLADDQRIQRMEEPDRERVLLGAGQLIGDEPFLYPHDRVPVARE